MKMFSFEPEQVRMMSRPSAATRFRTRKDAERALAEIIEDGGAPADYRIDEHPLGGFVISVFDDSGQGVIGA